MRVVVINADWDRTVHDPESWLARAGTLTGWSEALLAAGAARVVVVQRFARDRRLVRDGVEYVFDAGTDAERLSEQAVATIAATDPDIVHVNGLGFPALLLHLARSLPRAALVAQDHADGVPRTWWSRRRARPGLARLDGVLFTAAAQAELWRRARLLEASCLVCEVPEASTPIGPLDRAAAQSAANLMGEPAMLWVGRLVPNKDPLTVLAGFARALPYLPRAALTMVYQDETLLPAVRAWLAPRPAVRARVQLRGFVPPERLAAFYSAADLFVLGSHREGSGYALLEALACGALPVVTDIAAFRALTAEGTHGVLWRAGDPAACAAALVLAAERVGEAARAARRDYFAQHLSWAALGRRARAAYDAIRAQRRERR
jgi:glycosyltransferase involved in cell wall biosynthesis